MPRKPPPFIAPRYVELQGHLVLPRCPHSVVHFDAATGKAGINSVNSSCSICTSTDLESVMKMLQPPKRDSKLPVALEPELEDDEITEDPDELDQEDNSDTGAHAEPDDELEEIANIPGAWA